MTRKDCLASRTDDAHLFGCPACRAEARASSAWRAFALGEQAADANDAFVARVLAGVGRDRARRLRRRFWMAAAAAALFFFFAGFAHERDARPASTAEEAYASLASPNALQGLIPN